MLIWSTHHKRHVTHCYTLLRSEPHTVPRKPRSNALVRAIALAALLALYALLAIPYIDRVMNWHAMGVR